jgi:hypothetical protein
LKVDQRVFSGLAALYYCICNAFSKFMAVLFWRRLGLSRACGAIRFIVSKRQKASGAMIANSLRKASGPIPSISSRPKANGPIPMFVSSHQRVPGILAELGDGDMSRRRVQGGINSL